MSGDAAARQARSPGVTTCVGPQVYTHVGEDAVKATSEALPGSRIRRRRELASGRVVLATGKACSMLERVDPALMEDDWPSTGPVSRPF